jgi:hypothetical protein
MLTRSQLCMRVHPSEPVAVLVSDIGLLSHELFPLTPLTSLLLDSPPLSPPCPSSSDIMGQSWLVVNLDNIRRLETGLKLGEGFVSMGSDLERYLLPRQLFEKMDPARLSVAMGCAFPSTHPVL